MIQNWRQMGLVVAGMLFPAIGNAEPEEVYQLSNGETVSPLEQFQECDVCPEMVVMPLGSFMMGAMPGESLIPPRGEQKLKMYKMEHPRHSVEMDIPYAIGRNEVTHAEWMACVADGGCTHVPEHAIENNYGRFQMGPNHPVFNVSLLDAQEYTVWLNTKVGEDAYRPPTEAEWEYAARAGTQSRFAQGKFLTSRQANFSGKSTRDLSFFRNKKTNFAVRYHPVEVDELDAANDWGLRHMSGNVSELTLSCFDMPHLGLKTDSEYLANAKSRVACRRVAKGGAFPRSMEGLRLAGRTAPKETRRRYFRGFRVVRIFNTGDT